MTRARHSQIDLTATSFYHVINRCVRRSYLCGEDKVSGQNFDHRRQWLVDRFMLLSDVFSINIAAYAVMSNHYHLVLHVDKVTADAWSMDEVITRWYRLFNGHLLVDRYVMAPATRKLFRLVMPITSNWLIGVVATLPLISLVVFNLKNLKY